MTSKYNTYRLKFGTQGFKLKNLLHFILEKFVLPIGEIIEEAVSEELSEEPEGSEFREEEEALSISSTSTNHPVTGIHSAFQCPSPTPLRTGSRSYLVLLQSPTSTNWSTVFFHPCFWGQKLFYQSPNSFHRPVCIHASAFT